MQHMCVPHGVAVAVCIVIDVVTFVVLVRFAIRDYRRRAGNAVTVHDDRVEIQHLGERVSVPFSEVRTVRLLPRRHDALCLLCSFDGGTRRLPAEIAPFSVARTALEATLLPWLAQRFGEELAGGSPVRVRESSLRARVRIVGGVLVIVPSIAAILTLRGIPAGLRWAKGGWLTARRGWRGRGSDFEISRQGVRRTGRSLPSDLHPWTGLREVCVDDAGVVLRYEDGRTITASIFSENYWPFAVWIRAIWQRSQ
jgi:hypothetical protein